MREMSLKDIQGVSLDILNEIHEFCQGNSIRYTLYYGTLLGAIRHNGFIPWDDDVDIAMPRPDYDRFINSYVSKKGYKLFSREINENENVYIPFSRVCEMEKTMVISPIIPWCSSLTGVWIDIFPHKPITQQPAGTRMGGGKGSVEYWVAVVKPGRMLFEMSGIDEATAREALRLASNKLPIKCKFVKREKVEGGSEE